jgi:PAS domain S-box-containing protein
MAGDYVYSPQIWPYLLTAGLLAALAAFSWRRRAIPGARPLAAAYLLAVPWVASAAAEAMAVDPATKIAWFKFWALWQLPAVTAITCFVLDYANPGRWLTRRTLVLLSILPLVQLALTLTNDLHHWLWLGFSVGGSVSPLRGPAAWILYAYGMGLMVVNLIAFAWLFVRSPPHRLPVALMLTGQVTARSLNVLEAAAGPGILGWDPFLPSIVFPLGIYAIALFGFRIFDPLQAAGRAAIEQMQEGMVVFDAGWRALSLNPAAAGILGVPAAGARGKTWAELLPSCPEAAQCLGAGEIPIEVNLRDDDASLRAGAGTRRYTLMTTSLIDHRAVTMGYLLLLHDVTEQRRAQAQTVEQQRALAMLHEREQLARELHDGIGQVLGYVKMQAQAARDRLAQDQVPAADADLAQLVAVAQDAHADVREYILGARAPAAVEPGLPAALEHCLERFSRQYGLRTVLASPPEWGDGLLEPTAEAQLLRIVQEALTNARKHARAGCVRVSVELDGDHVAVTVEDDGVGFDPALLATGEGQKYGLGFMRERAHEVGGCIEFHSAPGEGTQVVVRVPHRKEGS